MQDQTLSADARLSPVLTPRLQYAVRLLQLSATDYEQELQEITYKNPFLDWDDRPAQRSVSVGAGIELVPVSATAKSESEFSTPNESAGADESHGEPDADAWPDHRSAHDSWNQTPGAVRDGARESQGSALDRVEVGTDLRHHLRSQANLLPISRRDHALVCVVIESLDDDGYLRIGTDEIEAMCELEPWADASEIGTAIRLVQSFDPVGVGARSVGECLLLQLESIAAPLRPLARRIVTDHLERLAQRDVTALAKGLDHPVAEIESTCAALRRLDPRPGWRFARPDVHFVTPDVHVRKVRGLWTVQLNASAAPRLRLNHSYAALFQRHREARHAEMNAHLQEARWTLRNVEQRYSTILAVSQAILKRQYGFFEHGPLAMKPLALREVATEIGVHESTVCRVTNNKYMATPAGLFELKQFFSRPMAMAGGGACSPTAIRGVMKALVEAEDTQSPLSDADITQRLERQGLKVARRTVTKYRQMLRIAPADRRRTGDTARA